MIEANVILLDDHAKANVNNFSPNFSLIYQDHHTGGNCQVLTSCLINLTTFFLTLYMPSLLPLTPFIMFVMI